MPINKISNVYIYECDPLMNEFQNVRGITNGQRKVGATQSNFILTSICLKSTTLFQRSEIIHLQYLECEWQLVIITLQISYIVLLLVKIGTWNFYS